MTRQYTYCSYLSAMMMLVLLAAMLLVDPVDGFTSLDVTATNYNKFSTCNTALSMVAKKKTGKQRNSSKPAGGFGGGTPAAAVNAQVRSVTGHTGSGTKPLRAAANTFDSLRNEFGADACRDVYVRSPLNSPVTFWFVGKIAVRPNLEPAVTPDMAIWSQKRLILEYAKHQLRPQNLGGAYSQQQDIWLAPGDSEMNVVQNKISLQKVEGSAANLPEGFVVKDTVGYNPEIYVGDEVQKGGLRVQRDPETGDPINPVFEVNESA